MIFFKNLVFARTPSAEKLGKIKTKRTFKVDLCVGHEETEIRGTPEYEKAWKEVDELRYKVSKKEEDEYRKSYGWKEGDPFRWTPHNDDPDASLGPIP